MLPNNERANKFVEAITREAMEKKAAIESEINEFVTAEMKSAELAALEESYKIIQKAGAEIHINSASQISASKAENRKKILSRRSEIADEVLQKVALKVQEFTKTDDYKDFLKKSATAAVGIFGDDMTIFVRSADKPICDQLSSISKDIKIEIDDKITLGGLHFSDKASVRHIDDTLDRRLEQGHEWFIKNSDLTVK